MLQNLLAILGEYGLASTVTLAILFVLFWIGKHHIYVKLPNHSSPTPRFECRKNNLLNHEFFINIEHKINFQLRMDTFSQDPARNILYQDIMVILFSVYRDILLDTIKKLHNDWRITHWSQAMLEFHYLSAEEFEKRCKNEGIPEQAIILFKEWLMPYIITMFKHINNVAAMPEEVDIITRTRFFLLTLELILVSVIADAQRFKKINGKLDGIEYKGLIL